MSDYYYFLVSNTLYLIVAVFLLFDAILTSRHFLNYNFIQIEQLLPVNTIIGCNLRPTKWFYLEMH